MKLESRTCKKSHRRRTAIGALPRFAGCGLFLFLGVSFGLANTITVNSTADAAANDGQCTLREAITAANSNTVSGALPGECGAGAAGLDTIVFSIAGGGVKTITPASLLPTITEAVTIDGYTQPGTSQNTNPLNAGINAVLLIEINGSLGGSQLSINGNGTTIRGLVFNRGGDEIRVNASNITIAGNFIGTNPAGTIAMGNPVGGFGIRQESGNNNVIGGATAAARNLISGDTQGAIILSGSDGNQILGNYIGTDVTGTLALNGTGIRSGVNILGPVFSTTSNTVISGNLISGNSGAGVITTSAGGLLLQGNLIGTQRDGVGALGNNQGVSIPAGNGNLVGGTSPGQGNIIRFSQGFGVSISPNAFGNGILGNSIDSNTQLGITLQLSGTPLANDSCDIDTIPGNRGQNYPVIASAVVAGGNVTVAGTLNSTASTTFRVEFFANAACDPTNNGEGQTYLGFTSVTTDVSCNASFGPLVFAAPPGQTIFTATATDPANNTSEFSRCFPLGIVPTPTVTPTPTPTVTGTVPPTSTPTATPPGATPTPTPPQGPAGVVVPTLSPFLLALFAAALALSAILLVRRNG